MTPKCLIKDGRPVSVKIYIKLPATSRPELCAGMVGRLARKKQ